jgi:erythromycin esterase-like protein
MGKNFISEYLIKILCVLIVTRIGSSAFCQAVPDTLYSSKIDNALLSKITNGIKDHRIVMLGEPTHGEGSIFETKTKIVKSLVEEGDFSVIAFESGIYDLWVANQKSKKGVEYKNAIKEAIFNIWSCSEEMKDFFSLLEKWKDKVEVVGFDSQFSSEYASEGIREEVMTLIAGNRIEYDSSLVDFWINTIEEMSETYSVSRDFDLKKFCKISDDLLQFFNKYEASDMRFWVQIFRSSKALAIDYYYNTPSSISKDKWKAENSNGRDEQMANNLIFLSRFYKNRKIICWGASAHFSKSFQSIDNQELKRYFPMGQIVADSLGSDVICSIAFTGAKGKYGIGDGPISDLTKPSANSLESTFEAKNIEYAFVKLNNADKKFSLRSIENVEVFGNWSTSFDGVFYSKIITPNTLNCDNGNLTKNDDQTQSTNLTRKTTEKTPFFIDSTINDSKEYFKSIAVGSYLTAKLFDYNTKEPVPYAHVIYQNSNIGAISELDGSFRIYKSNSIDSIKISCIGYATRTISAKKIKDNTIYLQPETALLKEIVIKEEKLTARSILKRVVRNFEKNYYQNTYSSVTSVTKNVRPGGKGLFQSTINILESKDKNGYTFSSPYPIRKEVETSLLSSKTLLLDTMRLDTISSVTNSKRIRSSVAFIDLLNYRKNTFLNPSKWGAFQFDLAEIIQKKDEGDVYRITFKCKRPSHFNTLQLGPTEYWGEIYVKARDYAVLEFKTFTKHDKTKIWQGENFPAYKTEVSWFNNTIVSYKKINGYYFLDKADYISNWDGFVEIKTLKIAF